MQSQSKRKAGMEVEGNPLLNAAKRSKKDKKNASNKNKLLANEETTRGGLVIVRESPFSQPESANERSSSQPSSSLPLKRNATTELQAPPNKKARAESQPLASSTKKSKPTPTPTPTHTSTSTNQHRSGSLPLTNGRLTTQQKTALRSGISSIAEEDEEQIEDDVRAMEAEANHLRRTSRVYVAESSNSTASTISFPSENNKPRPRSRSRSRMSAVDTIQPLADESLQIVRNKRIREGAMAAITAVNGDATHAETSRRGREREREQNTVNGHHRRKSSISSRGKRISTSFEITGVIPQPHSSVSYTSFYKHIDADLPDSERLRMLLIWCASRAAAKLNSTSIPNSTSAEHPNEDNPGSKNSLLPIPDLPPLSARAQQIVKRVQEDVIQMLAEREIDLSLHGHHQTESSQGLGKNLKQNEQNVTNKMLEALYGKQIKRVHEEEEAWKRVTYHYDAYIKRQKELLERRKARLTPLDRPPSSQTDDGPGGDEMQPTTPSAKSKGKQRESGGDDPWRNIREHLLPEDMQRGARLVRALLASVQPKPPGQTQSQESSTAIQKRPRRGSDTAISDVDMDLTSLSLDQELENLMQDLHFKLDWLYSAATTARSMVYVVEELNNRWFSLLNQNLASRVDIRVGSTSSREASSSSNSAPTASSSSSLSTTTDPSRVSGILRKYVRRPHNGPPGFIINPPASFGTSQSWIPASSGVDPQDLLRALSLVDRTRPPSQVGDAARRAAREVQRVGENGGIGIVGDRRITGITPGAPNTPRKGPMTPSRRGGDKTSWREREKTPVRDR
ncbi:hypothetical protein M378DRAFT_78848 [Amanita muscaria Koide BX008]|uniref:Uncharacterized protein n=1 Tax=Amanita muscaria (strain Koide BX008) TaxID=946122 RepID=A0A0C2WQY6_AMAMK|nr:hypothetical protein M378DRAFT_78848 [Amanita muscaria Koide BX008]